MAALAAATLALLQQGDDVVVSDKLYGRTAQLLTGETARLGVTSSVVDTCDLAATGRAIGASTRLVVVETITNPLVRVSDLEKLSALCRERGARLLVDNTFASPALCRPLDWGADLVVESLTKIMSGHSDVLLGVLCGRDADWSRVPLVASCWGLSASPFDCWLALRGLGTLALRADRASANALAAARFLQSHARVESVRYPGLADHPEHALAGKLLGGRYGSIVAFTLRGERRGAEQFIRATRETIPFCPSLGDLSTTLSHPASTSHRAVPPAERETQGIKETTIRLSVGIESPSAIVQSLQEGLDAVR
jgi:cystathionine beta-lyase/cystathionine gamma-synthase